MRELAQILRRGFAWTSITWAGALVLAPLLASRPRGLAAYAISLVMYGIGGVVCHQTPERSFRLWDAHLPVCARCTGIYLGAAAAAMAALWWSRGRISGAELELEWVAGRAVRGRTAMIAALTPMMLTVVYEWTAGAPGNWIRAASGLPPGAVIAWIVLKVD